jgi:hypothetical protein
MTFSAMGDSIPAFGWDFDCLFDCPTTRQAPGQQAIVDAKPPRPLPLRQRYASVCQKPGTALVALIHCPRHPAHVARLVVAIVVDAVQFMAFRGPAAYIVQKLWKVMSPLIADTNPSAPVIGKRSAARIATTVDDGAPQLVLRCFPREAVRLDAARCHLDLVAATGSYVLSKQHVGCADKIASAVAAANPITLARWSVQFFSQYRDAAETSARQIASRHGRILSQ